MNVVSQAVSTTELITSEGVVAAGAYVDGRLPTDRAEAVGSYLAAHPEIRERLSDPPSYSAVRAHLRLLEEKRDVTFSGEKVGSFKIYATPRFLQDDLSRILWTASHQDADFWY